MSFKAFFLFAIAGLAALSLAVAFLMLVIISEASTRVANGRLASDAVVKLQAAHASIVELERVLLTEAAPAPAIQELASEISIQLTDVEAIHRSLVSGSTETVYANSLIRDEALRTAFQALEVKLDGIDTRGLAEAIDQSVALRFLLNDALRAEKQALAEKRTEADTALTSLTVIVYSAVAVFLVALIFVYRQLRLRLDPAVSALEDGLAALKNGNLKARITVHRRDEFGRLAEIFNFAASKLQDVQDRDASIRQILEENVAARTADLSRALQEMQNLANRRGKLFSDLGHELRTPLTIIRGEAEVALRNANAHNTPLSEAFRSIRSAAQQMGVLLDDLLDVSKADEPALAIDLKEACPDQSVQNALTLFNKDRGRLEVSLYGESAKCNIDPLRLQQAILVVLENAIFYSDQSSKVLVETSVSNDVWTLNVTDFGMGLTPDQLERIFERGYRGELARDRRPGGLGFGLSIAKALIERQGGTLSAQSNGLKAGSTFSIAFNTSTWGVSGDPCSADRGRSSDREIY